MRNASSSIALATGPASRPPVLAEISALVPLSITTTTYFGSSTGAKATIQACERCGLAGPVELGGARLGGDGDPVVEADAATRRAALGDADHQVCCEVPAVWRLIGRFHTSGCVRLITLPSWSSSASTTNGFIISPSLATVAATIAMWSGTIWSSF